jgi:hypothetical protein
MSARDLSELPHRLAAQQRGPTGESEGWSDPACFVGCCDLKVKNEGRMMNEELCQTGVAASRQRAALLNLPEKCGGLPTGASAHRPQFVAAGILACRIQRHLCRPDHKNKPTSSPHFHIRPPGWKPDDTAAKDGCRYGAVRGCALCRPPLR